MQQKSLVTLLLSAGLAASFPALAAGMGDARSLAMGGVGVTTATARNGAFFNPAALAATRDDDRFAFNLTAALRLYDPDRMRDEVRKVEDSGDELTLALDALNHSVDAIDQRLRAGQTPTQAQIDRGAGDAARSQRAINDFDAALRRINGKPLALDLAGGGIVAIPGKTLGLGVMVSGRVDIGQRFNYATADSGQMTGHATTAGQIAAALTACRVDTPETCAGLLAINPQYLLDDQRDSITNSNDELNNILSSVDVRGVVVAEAGLTLASRIGFLGDLDIGITPKVQKVRTFNYSVSAQDPEIDADRGMLDFSNFNLDIGATKVFGDRVKAGVVVRNALTRRFDFVAPNGGVVAEKYEIRPEARVGISHHSSWTTLGLDADLNKNKGLPGDFNGRESQFVRLGAELDVWLLQLRLGYRHDLTGHYEGLPSVGLALKLPVIGLHVDVGAAGNDQEAAASLQVGLSF